MKMQVLPGAICSREELEAEVKSLSGSGMFNEVDGDTVANPDGTITVREQVQREGGRPVQHHRSRGAGAVCESRGSGKAPGIVGAWPIQSSLS